MFHYNMACTYAEMNDEDQAIVYLKSAFENRDNMIEGEEMPDPATDDSFARFMKDEKFLKTLKEIKRRCCEQADAANSAAHYNSFNRGASEPGFHRQLG